VLVKCIVPVQEEDQGEAALAVTLQAAYVAGTCLGKT
jgi:hypothetical protein